MKFNQISKKKTIKMCAVPKINKQHIRVLNSVECQERVWGSVDIALCTSVLVTKQVANFTPWSFYSREKIQ